MNFKSLLLLLFLLMFALSCSKDFGTTEVTYTKAVAIYGDIEEIRNTSLIGTVQPIIDPGKIYVSDDFILIGEEEKGIHILDNSDPSSPNNTLFLNIPGNREFFVADGFIYAESYYDMIKIDIRDIHSPVIADRLENYFESNLLDNSGDAVIGFEYQKVTEKVEEDNPDFWSSFYNYDQVFFDFNQSVIPPSAVPASFAGSSNKSIGSVNRIAKSGGHIYAVNNEKLSVISDSDLELVITRYIGNQKETVYPRNEYLFIGGTNSVDILDISNPANPTTVNSFLHPTSCDPVYPLDEVAYVTLRTGDEGCPGDVNSLVTLDISNINNVTMVDQIEMESPYGVSLIGNQLFVGEGKNGLKIFDATDRLNLVQIKFDESIQAYDVIRHPSRSDIVLIAGPEGFGQYDVDDNNAFELISWISY